MAIGAVTKYNNLQSHIFKDASRQWDDPTVGNLMFLLVTQTYTPAVAHDTVLDLGGNYISAGDGAPIAVGTPSIDEVTTPGSVYFDSLAADFGTNLNVVAKYLVCIQPTTPNTVANTDKLLWYVDLNTASGTSDITVSNATLKINTPTNGWVKV